MDFRDVDEEIQSHSIDREIKLHEKELQHEVKILLLGAGESGKTTILKVWYHCDCFLHGSN